MGLRISLGQNDNEKIEIEKKYLAWAFKLRFLVVSPLLAFILLHLGLVKYVWYQLLEGYLVAAQYDRFFDISVKNAENTQKGGQKGHFYTFYFN